ncbi:MAG TPA: M67 family metallopeptidase [Acidimicrobiia bacterium]|nr:M67 family metallopeptidase [Acidimicrobiia bacterium]
MADPLASPTLRLTRAQHDTVVAHCLDGFPDEACGLFSGPLDDAGATDGRVEPTGEVTEVHPCRNADASARTYTVDSRDLLRAMRSAESRGDEIVGVWHSHTHTDPYPSTTDVRQAVDATWIYAIVSLKYGAPSMRAYRIVGGEIAEVAVEVTD